MEIFDLVGEVRIEGGDTVLSFLDKLSDFLFAASDSSKDFEQQLANTAAVSNMTGKEINMLRDQALKLGKDTKFSALEVAEGQETMARSGRNIIQIMNEMGDVLNLAAAENLNVADATEILVDTMSIFDRQGLSSADVANILSGAVSSSTIDIHDMQESLKYVGPTAASLNIPLKEISATIALLGKNGIKGSQAGTGLRQMLSRLSPTTKTAIATFKKLGLITEDNNNLFYDAQGKLKPLGDIFTILRDKMEGLTDKEKQDAVKKMFGLIADPTVKTILNADAESFDQLMASISKSDVAEKASIRMDTLAGTIEFLRGSIETFLIKVGDMINPFVRPFVKALSTIMDLLLQLPPNIIAGFAAFAGLVALIGPIIAGITTLTIIIGFLISAITVIAPIVEGITASMIGMAAGIGAGIAIVGSLIAGFVALILSSERVRNAISEKFNAIKNIISEVSNFIKTNIDNIKGAFKGLIEGITSGNFGNFIISMKELVPSETMQKIHNIVMKFVEFRDKVIEVRDKIIEFGMKVYEIISPIQEMFMNAFKSFDISNLIQSFSGLYQAIQPLMPILQGIAVVIGTVLAAAIGIFYSGITAIISAIPNLIGIITSAIGIIISTVSALVTGIIAIFTGDWAAFEASLVALWENIKNLFINAGMAIWNIVKGFITGLISFFTNLYQVLVGGSIIPDMINAIVQWFISLPGKILGIIASFVSSIISKFNSLKSSVISVFNNLKSSALSVWNSIKSTISSVASSIMSVVVSRFNSLRSSISSILSSIRSVFSSIWNSIRSTVSSIVSGVVSAVSSRLSSLRSSVSSALSSVKSTFISIWNGIKSTVVSIVSGMVSTIKGLISGISGVISTISGKIGGLISKAQSAKSLIPGFASGVKNFEGGLAIVGELGPELVKLPKGSDIYSNTETSGILSNLKPVGLLENNAGKSTEQINLYGDIVIDAKSVKDFNDVVYFVQQGAKRYKSMR